jgi:hypothetical protein
MSLACGTRIRSSTSRTQSNLKFCTPPQTTAAENTKIRHVPLCTAPTVECNSHTCTHRAKVARMVFQTAVPADLVVALGSVSCLKEEYPTFGLSLPERLRLAFPRVNVFCQDHHDYSFTCRIGRRCRMMRNSCCSIVDYRLHNSTSQKQGFLSQFPSLVQISNIGSGKSR